MGTSKSLRIAVSLQAMDAPWVQELLKQGHTVEGLAHTYDLVLLPEAARFLPGMEIFLAGFLKGARAIKFPAKIKA